jgi:hypothetical protein
MTEHTEFVEKIKICAGPAAVPAGARRSVADRA